MSDYFTPPPKPGCRIRFELSHRNLQFEIAPVSVWLDQDDLELCEAHVFLADAIMHAAENDGRVTWGIYIASIGHPLRHVMDQEDPKKIINDLDFHFGEEVVGAYIRAIYYFHNHDMFKPRLQAEDQFLAPSEGQAAGDPVVLACAAEGTGRSLHGVRPGQEIGGSPGDDAEEHGSATLGELRRAFSVLALQDHRARRALQGNPDVWSAITCYLGLTTDYQVALVKRLGELEMIAPRKVRVVDKTFIWNCPIDKVPEEKIDPTAL